MISRKRRLFAKIVSIIMLVSTVMTSNGIVMAAETRLTQVIASNQGNKKTENVTEVNRGKDLLVDNKGSNETEVSNSIVSSLVDSNVSANMIASENSGISLLSSSSDLVSGNYTYTLSGGKATITGYTGSAKTISIPTSISDYPVTGIGI